MKTTKKWTRPEQTKQYMEGVEYLKTINTYALSDPIIEFLYNRGVKTKEALDDILNVTGEHEHSPTELKDMDKAVESLKVAISKDKKIVVYGDYDCDGVSATAIAVKGLRNLGANVDYFINNRFVEGYGISPLGVDNMLKQIPDAEFVLTVDNGIVAFEGVEYANEKGLDVLVTDHHLAEKRLPNALAVVNPHRLDDTSTFKHICGATVIYKVMMSLYWELGEDLTFVKEMIDLVGMATVGDVMPLLNENRFFVSESINLIEKGNRPQFTLLKDRKNVGIMNEEVFGFQFVPTINAVGRLDGSPRKAVDFFLTDDTSEMEKLVDELIEINEKRKEITVKQESLAESLIKKQGVEKVLIVSHEDFHEGIVGLVAGRLKETYHRPTIVFSEENGKLKGSARSIEGFHIKHKFDEMNELILQYGGHELAAGLSIERDKLEDFKKRINEIADDCLTEDDLIAKIEVDAVLTPQDITEDFIEELDSIRPFGAGFRSPVFGLKDFSVGKVIYMGQDKNHLKLVDQRSGLEIVMFKYAERYLNAGEPTRVKALGTPKINNFMGKTNIQFSVESDCLAF